MQRNLEISETEIDALYNNYVPPDAYMHTCFINSVTGNTQFQKRTFKN